MGGAQWLLYRRSVHKETSSLFHFLEAFLTTFMVYFLLRWPWPMAHPWRPSRRQAAPWRATMHQSEKFKCLVFDSLTVASTSADQWNVGFPKLFCAIGTNRSMLSDIRCHLVGVPYASPSPVVQASVAFFCFVIEQGFIHHQKIIDVALYCHLWLYHIEGYWNWFSQKMFIGFFPMSTPAMKSHDQGWTDVEQGIVSECGWWTPHLSRGKSESVQWPQQFDRRGTN